jgi:hypothetical protein
VFVLIVCSVEKGADDRRHRALPRHSPGSSWRRPAQREASVVAADQIAEPLQLDATLADGRDHRDVVRPRFRLRAARAPMIARCVRGTRLIPLPPLRDY